MHRKVFVSTLAAATLAARYDVAFAGDATEADYDLVTPTGTIFGSSLLPSGPATMPVALIVAGSGPTDRNGNSALIAVDTYKKLAYALAAHGIASVRYDKRGIALSRAALTSEDDVRFDAYVDDAAAWIAKLRADKRFTRVTLVGHSEGSLVGMIAVQGALVDSYVSLEGAGFPADVVLRKQLAAQLAASPGLLADSTRILDSLVKGQPATDVPRSLASLFRPSVQSYLISWFKYDPRVEIAKVAARTTIVQGTHDIQVSVDDGKALAAAKPNATFVLIDGMTHVLSDDPATTLAEQLKGAYVDAARPLDPRVADATVAAIR